MTTDITATLQERGSRYGKFTGHAEISQALKRAIGERLAFRGKSWRRTSARPWR